MKTEVAILGAGISGAIMAEKLRARNIEHILVDELSAESLTTKQEEVPKFLHRPIEGMALKKIPIQTGIWYKDQWQREPTIAAHNAYSLKTTGKIVPTAVFNQIKEGWLFPGGFATFHKRMLYGSEMLKGKAQGLNLRAKMFSVGAELVYYKILVSTIPLPVIKEAIEDKIALSLESKPIWITTFTVPEAMEVHQIIYVADENQSICRIFLFGDKLAIESTCQNISTKVARNLLGLSMLTKLKEKSTKCLLPGRFLPLPAEKRKKSLYQLTRKYDVFFLGRYGTWSYKRTEHVWEDAEQIADWIEGLKGVIDV